ncbi:MAG TPA: hypothetical protein VIL20_23220 [Sandaracinaceae bacterium]
MLAYCVRIEVPSETVADELLRWLEDDHAAQVVRAGALDAEVVRLDGSPIVVEARYHFASREAFAAYEAGPAAALRADGLARFGPERGVRMSRSVGEVLVCR